MPMIRARSVQRNVLLCLLGFTAGATDAASFERLGHVFSSVITGNLILLGVGAVSGDGRSALMAGCAIAGYAIGVLLTAPGRAEHDQDKRELWPARSTAVLAVDLALLVAFAVIWEVVAGHPGRGTRVALLCLAAGAMGAQSSAVRRMGQFSTTYLTSTLTGILEMLRVRRWDVDTTRSVGILAAAIAGAATATALILRARAWLPAAQLLPLVVVVLSAPWALHEP